MNNGIPILDDEMQRTDAADQKRGEWISVEDNPPPIGETVLTLSKYNHVSDRQLRLLGETAVFSPDGMIPGKDVKWWMPMPEPPKGGRA